MIDDDRSSDSDDDTPRTGEVTMAYRWSFFGTYFASGYLGAALARVRRDAAAREADDPTEVPRATLVRTTGSRI